MVHQGKVCDHLDMDIYYRNKLIVNASMEKYMNNVIKEFSENLGTTAAMSDYYYLFKVRN